MIIFSILREIGSKLWEKMGSKGRSFSDLLVPILLVAIATESVILYRGYERVKKMEESAKALTNTVSNIGRPAKNIEVKTKRGIVTAAVTEPLSLTKQNIKDRYSEDLAVSKSMGVKADDVNDISHLALVTIDTVTVPIIVNKFGGKDIHYTDDFATINVEIDSTKYANIDYSIKDSLVITSYQKKHKFLFGLIRWKEQKKTEVHSLNPKAKIIGLEIIEKLE